MQQNASRTLGGRNHEPLAGSGRPAEYDRHPLHRRAGGIGKSPLDQCLKPEVVRVDPYRLRPAVVHRLRQLTLAITGAAEVEGVKDIAPTA